MGSVIAFLFGGLLVGSSCIMLTSVIAMNKIYYLEKELEQLKEKKNE